MKKSLYSRPDAHSLSPFLLLLPVRASISRLENLTSSLFARYERVAALRKELDLKIEEGGRNDELDKSAAHRLEAEQAMLRQVLDYLSVRPED